MATLGKGLVLAALYDEMKIKNFKSSVKYCISRTLITTFSYVKFILIQLNWI